MVSNLIDKFHLPYSSYLNKLLTEFFFIDSIIYIPRFACLGKTLTLMGSHSAIKLSKLFLCDDEDEVVKECAFISRTIRISTCKASDQTWWDMRAFVRSLLLPSALVIKSVFLGVTNIIFWSGVWIAKKNHKYVNRLDDQKKVTFLTLYQYELDLCPQHCTIHNQMERQGSFRQCILKVSHCYRLVQKLLRGP